MNPVREGLSEKVEMGPGNQLCTRCGNSEWSESINYLGAVKNVHSGDPPPRAAGSETGGKPQQSGL